MAIDINSFKTNNAKSSIFGNKSNQQDETARPKAEFWLNIGYETGNEERPFVSLPTGIPLDTQEHVRVSGNNEDYAQFMQAKNHLLDQLMEEAKKLNPGETCLVPLMVEIRRVGADRTDAPIEGNKYIMPLLGQKAE